jgi:O-antigen ligase
MAMPFLFHFAIQPYRLRVRVAATLTIPFAVYIIYLSHSRTGWVGLVLSCLLYPAVVLFIAIKRGRATRWAGTALAGYPVAGVLGMTVVLASGRLRHLLLGGREASASNLARVAQWQMGLPKIFKNPIGHGLGTSGSVLGYTDPTGLLTLDSYYLAILLELGVVGFLVYFGMFVFGIFTAVRAAARSPDLEREVYFLAPAAVSITNFVVIKSIFSEMDNHWMAFTLLGMVAALVARANPQPSLAIQAGAQLRTSESRRAGGRYFAPSR